MTNAHRWTMDASSSASTRWVDMIAPVRWALSYIPTTNIAKVRILDIIIIIRQIFNIILFRISYFYIIFYIQYQTRESFVWNPWKTEFQKRFDYNNIVHVPVEVMVSRRDFFFSISFYFRDYLSTMCSFTKTLCSSCAMCS